MKRVTLILVLFAACLHLQAQTRSYADNATSTFVVGLQSYFFGDNGTLGVTMVGRTASVRLEEGKVWVDGVLLEEGDGQTLVGAHDFTGDNQPELVVAHRTEERLSAKIYRLSGKDWLCIGHVGAGGAGVRDIRVFRQALTIRNYDSGVLYTWTWRGGRFDFKSSDGSPEP